MPVRVTARNHCTIALLVSLAALISAGCIRNTGTAYIQNPARSGVLGPSRANYGAGSASIVRFTPAEVCFQVELSSHSSYQSTDLPAYDLHLEVDGDQSNPIRSPRLAQLSPGSTHVEQRAVPYDIQTGSSTECVIRNRYGQCDRVERRPIYGTAYEAVNVDVVTVPWVACFPNQGRIGPATAKLALVLPQQDPYTDVEFVWMMN